MRRKHKIHIAGIIIILAFVVSACTGCTDHGFKKTLERYESLADALLTLWKNMAGTRNLVHIRSRNSWS